MSRAVWVTKDGDGWYKVHPQKPISRYVTDWVSDSYDLFRSDEWERVMRFRLKPGEGPIKVRIEVKRVKEKGR